MSELSQAQHERELYGKQLIEAMERGEKIRTLMDRAGAPADLPLVERVQWTVHQLRAWRGFEV